MRIDSLLIKKRKPMRTKVFIIAGLFLSALLLSGCKTIKQSERIEIHDTLTIHHSDTVKEYKMKKLFDTVHHYHHELITLNEGGDTVKQIINNTFRERIIERDSSDTYKSKIDSLARVINELQQKEKVVEKKDWWAEWKWRLITFAAIVVALLLAIRSAKDIISRSIIKNKDQTQ